MKSGVLQQRLTWGTALVILLLAGLPLSLILFSHGNRPESRRRASTVSSEPVQRSDDVSGMPVPERDETTAPPDDGEGIVVQGRVLNRDGHGIPGAKVCCVVPDGLQGLLRLGGKTGPYKDEAFTDENGAYAVRAFLPDTLHTFWVSASHYLTNAEKVKVPKTGLSNLDFTLDPACLIAGRVLDVTRRPIEGAVVVVTDDDKTVQSPRAREGGVRRVSAPTGSTGGFEIVGLPPGGPYQLTVQPQPRGRFVREDWLVHTRVGPEITLVPGQQRKGVELVVDWDAARFVEGVVVSESGAPVSNANVWAEVGGRVAAYATDPAGTEGQFRIEYIPARVRGIAADTVTVVGTCPDYERAALNDVPVGSRGIEVVLPSARRGVITGVVLDDATRKPVEKSKVVLREVRCEWGETRRDNAGYAALSGDGDTDKGRFHIEDIPAGVATLVAYAPKYGVSLVGDIVVRAGEETDVELLLSRAGTLEYTLVPLGNSVDIPMDWCALCVGPAGGQPAGRFIGPDTYSNFLGKEWDYSAPPDLSGEMDLAPGAYDGVLFVQTRQSRQVEGYVTCEYAWYHVPLEVASGRTTEVEAAFGGTASVLGRTPFIEDHPYCYAVLLAGSDIAPLRPIASQSFQEFRGPGGFMSLVFDYGEVHQIPTSSEAGYCFASLQPGTYTLGIVVFAADEVTYLLGSKTVSLSEGEQAEVNLQR